MALVAESELLAATGLTQRSALVRHLRAARIPFRTVAGKIWTTSEAITAAMLGKKNTDGPNFSAIAPEGQDQPRAVLLRLKTGKEGHMGPADQGR